MFDKTRGGVLPLTAALLFLVACGGTGDPIELNVLFDPGAPRAARDDAERVEVHLVTDCSEVLVGVPPEQSIATTFTLRGETMAAPLGEVDPGSYGLYAFAQDANCAVVAAGCAEVAVNASTSDPLEVTMSGFSGPPCGSDQECVVQTGECTGDPDPCEMLAELAPCVANATTGLCRGGACCIGCWEGEVCHPGTQTQQCGTNGEACAFIPGCNP